MFEKVLIKFEKKLPSSNVTKLTVDMDLLKNPEKTLDKILLTDGIESFQKEFLVEHGIYLTFDDSAKAKIASEAKEKNLKVFKLCDDLFHDYFHGIRLMNLENFTITEGAVADPEKYLDTYIKENYKK